jgi:hypothetical protein
MQAQSIKRRPRINRFIQAPPALYYKKRKNIKRKKPIFPHLRKTKHFKKKLEEEMLTCPALRKDRNKNERMCVAPDYLFQHTHDRDIGLTL